MSTPFVDVGRPTAETYQKGRKLYLIPLFTAPMGPTPEGNDEDAPEASPLEEELRGLLARYWSGAEEHIVRLEATLGKVDRLYHENLVVAGDAGDKLLEQINPYGFTLIRNRIMAGAELEATEDGETLAETADWLTCLRVGLISPKASSTVYQAYVEATNKRYEHIGAQVDRTLKEDEKAILVVGDNHRVQFPSDMQVFYVAPPALDELRRWIDEHLKGAGSSGQTA